MRRSAVARGVGGSGARELGKVSMIFVENPVGIGPFFCYGSWCRDEADMDFHNNIQYFNKPKAENTKLAVNINRERTRSAGSECHIKGVMIIKSRCR